MRIAYLGSPGSYNYCAARLYEKQAECVGLPSFRALFIALKEGKVDALVLPVENSTTGTLYETYDLLHEFGFPIAAELYIPIDHALLVKPGTKIDDILVVYAHPKAFEQCRKFLATHPLIKAELASDTAQAARLVAENELGVVGAIGTTEAARIYGLEILTPRLEDNIFNITRFVVVAKSLDTKSYNKCSVVFTVPHTPGSLVDTIDLCAKHGVNLTKIESRPIPGTAFEYLFYLDFEGEATQIEKTCKALSGVTKKLSILGKYQSAKSPKKS